MKVRVTIAALLALALPFLSFAEGAKETAKAGQPVEMSILMKEHTTTKLSSDLPYFQYLKEATGVKLNVIAVPVADWGTKFNVVMASGDLPDIVTAGLTDAKYYGQQGAFIDLAGLIAKNAPNTTKYMKEYGTYHLLGDKNELYWYPAFIGPNLGLPKIPNYVLMYRTDWARKLGVTAAPDSVDGWLALWRKVKQADPAKVPLMAYGGVSEVFFPYFAGAYGFNTRIDDLGWYWKVDGEKLVSARKDAQFRELISLFRTLLREGLLDPEYLTRTKTNWSEVTTAGTVFSTIYTGNRAESFTKNGRTAGIADYDMRIVMNAKGPYGTASWWSGPYDTNSGMAITKNAKNPAAAVRLFDYVQSPEGVSLGHWGKEGVSYEMKNGGPVWKEGFGLGTTHSAPAYWIFGPIPKFIDTNSVWLNYDYYTKPMSDIVKTVQIQIPFLKLTNAEVEERQKIESNVKPFFEEWVNDFIRDKKNLDTQWNEFVQGMDKMGESRLEAVYTAAYKRYLEWKKTN